MEIFIVFNSQCHPSTVVVHSIYSIKFMNFAGRSVGERCFPFPVDRDVGPVLPAGEGGGAEHSGLHRLLGVVSLYLGPHGVPNLPILQHLGDGLDVRGHVAVLEQ